MFFHILKYKLIGSLKSKEGIFWVLCFPLILSTLFYFAFQNLSETVMFEKIDVAIIENTITDENFVKAMEDSKLFNITKTTKEEAKKLLDNSEITGYVSEKNGLEMTVKKTGYKQSVLNLFLNNYSQVNSTITTIYMTNPQGSTEEFLGSLNTEPSYINQIPINDENDNRVSYYYALLAMTCLMTATWGVFDIINIQANQSSIAARLSISPTHKLKIFFASISGTIIFQFISVLIVLGYMTQVLGIDFGNSVGYIILLSFVSTLAGITFGTAVSSLIKANECIKMAIVIAFFNISSFLAGLQSQEIKYSVQKAFPAIGYINPASLITDGFLSLYYYQSLGMYFRNLSILIALFTIFSVITLSVLRRQKYASI